MPTQCVEYMLVTAVTDNLLNLKVLLKLVCDFVVVKNGQIIARMARLF